MAASLFAGMGAQSGGDMMSQTASFLGNKAAAGEAYDRWKNMQTRGPGYMMQGLRAAGINPILAAGGGIKAGASGRPPQAAPATSRHTNVLAGAQMKLLQSQTSAADAVRDKTKSEQTLVDIRAALEATEMPRKKFLEQYFASPNGQLTLEMMQVNEALPNSFAGLAGKGMFSATVGGRQREVDLLMESAGAIPYEVKEFLKKWYVEQHKTNKWRRN